MNISPIKNQISNTVSALSTSVIPSALKKQESSVCDSFSFSNVEKCKNAISPSFRSLKTAVSDFIDAIPFLRPTKTTELSPFTRIEGSKYKIKSLSGKSSLNKQWYVSETKGEANRIITIFKDGKTSLSGTIHDKTVSFDTKSPQDITFSNIYLKGAKIMDINTGITYNLPNTRIRKNEECSFADIINLVQQKASNKIKD